MIAAYIMAGGSGKRFWPLSTDVRPKQLLHLVSKQSMLKDTVDRILPIVKPENIYVGTNAIQEVAIRRELHEIPADNIIVEPEFKNTAAAIGLAAVIIKKKHGNIPMVVLPADHSVKDDMIFQHALLMAIDEAKKGVIVTLGIRPDKPEIGYGYIETDSKISLDIIKSVPMEVIGFREKPDLQTAKAYMNSGKYLWNSGMFVFTTNGILEEIQRYMPDHYRILMEISHHISIENFSLKSYFSQFEDISIDYGVMEKSKNIKTIPTDFGWNDIGTFTALEAIYEKNANGSINKAEKLIEIDSKNNIVISNQTVALVGIEDVVVVEQDGSILICKKDCVQKVNKVTEKLKGGVF
ncbi:MAG: mannose-1-phosphate guanylyltransferase [Tissierellales bacterium]|nr:mannose-1-phosphate guanylyltransferase [Tissierellales bacterium]MBN2827271.1 mannose-1-phosphate guanylyltransferase [Tissierellales bacterium]